MARILIPDPTSFDRSLTQAEASEIFDSRIYLVWTPVQRVLFQLPQKFMVMPWRDFDDALQEVVGRTLLPDEYENPEKVIEDIKKNHGLA